MLVRSDKPSLLKVTVWYRQILFSQNQQGETAPILNNAPDCPSINPENSGAHSRSLIEDAISGKSANGQNQVTLVLGQAYLPRVASVLVEIQIPFVLKVIDEVFRRFFAIGLHVTVISIKPSQKI